MRYLRANTATIVTVGPFLDKTDGVTLETALTITNERISFVVDANDGSAPTLVLDNVTGATSGTDNDLNYITNNDAALMQLELSASNTNHAGSRATLTITDAANHCPVFHEFTILPAQVYDSLVLGSDLLDINVSTNGDKTGYGLTSAYDVAKGTVAMTESYAANGAAPTLVQAMYAIHQMMMQFAISGTSLTVKQLDNSTPAFVVTLDSATKPTSAERQ